MSRSLNKVLLIGNVGAEPEVRSTASGQKLAKCSLATNRSFTGRDGQQQEKTEWHRLTFWGKLADIVEQYVHKGDRLYVEGRIEYSQSGEGDNQRYWTDVVVQDMVMLGAQSGGGAGGGEGGGWQRQQRQAPAAAAASPFDEEDDDLPF